MSDLLVPIDVLRSIDFCWSLLVPVLPLCIDRDLAAAGQPFLAT